jgi:hypothetical protein
MDVFWCRLKSDIESMRSYEAADVQVRQAMMPGNMAFCRPAVDRFRVLETVLQKMANIERSAGAEYESQTGDKKSRLIPVPLSIKKTQESVVYSKPIGGHLSYESNAVRK